jgi:hypothetical protein
MKQYILNPENSEYTIEKIFNSLLKFIKIEKSYKTLSGRSKHKIIRIEGKIKVKRNDAKDEPEITFEEFIKVINLFRNGKSYNTTSKEIRAILNKPTNVTSLLSILLASDIIIAESKPIKYLFRYTSLPFLLDTLVNQRITLIDQKRWEDSNDSYFMEKYKEKAKKETLLAMCFVQFDSKKVNAEKYHFWKIYSDNSSGICIVFDKLKLVDVLNSIEGCNLRYKNVNYFNIDNIEIALKKHQIRCADLPFTKRSAFSDEREYRIIYESSENIITKEIKIPMDIISNIIFNPWIPESVYDSACKVIKRIKYCKKIQIERSTCLEYERWKKVGDNICS